MLASKLGLSRTTAEVVVVTVDAPVPTHVFSVNANELGRRRPSRLISVARLGLETPSPPGAAAVNVPAIGINLKQLITESANLDRLTIFICSPAQAGFARSDGRW